LYGGVVAVSYKPIELHVAMLNYLRAIKALGGGDQKITILRGTYSEQVDRYTEQPRSRLGIVRNIVKIVKEKEINYRSEYINAKTINEILEDVARDGVNYRDRIYFFTFRRWPFKPGIMERLFPEDMPSRELYERLRMWRESLKAELSEETVRRFKDQILINRPPKDIEPDIYDNGIIYELWNPRETPWAFLLLESERTFRGRELGEERPV